MGDTPLGIRLMGMGLVNGPVSAPIIGIDECGRALIHVMNIDEPVSARCAAADSTVPSRDRIEGAEALVVFEDGDPRRPIIVGFVRDELWQTPAAPVTARPAAAIVEGDEEVVIRCGKSSIQLMADGRIVIKGTRLTSRATESNKIRGGVVLIN